MSLSEIKAIVFDAYGTLLNVSSIDQLLNDFFDKKGAAIAKIWRQKQLEYTWLRTLMNRYQDFNTVTVDALSFACQQAQVTLSPEQRDALMEAYDRLSVYKDVHPALEHLSKHFRLAVLSNANPEMLEAALSYNSVPQFLEVLISVDETRHFKPYPEVYRLAEQKLAIPAEQILFISSNTWDVAGAKSFGLKVAWVNRFEGYIEELGFQPDLIITDLEGLIQ